MKEKKKSKKTGGSVASNIAFLFAVALIVAVSGIIISKAVKRSAHFSEPPATGESGPVISGAHDILATVGEPISYRSGVTAYDASGNEIPLRIDAGHVNPDEPGEYIVTYTAEDDEGRIASVTVRVIVSAVSNSENTSLEPSQTSSSGTEPTPGTDPPPTDTPNTEPPGPEYDPAEKEKLDNACRKVLADITNDDMTPAEKAEKIFLYVNHRIRYVSTSEKKNWVSAAYTGYTQKKGDCYNYFALSKELLTLAGIDSIDLYRVGGKSDHYWQLINTGDGWYHFDACPHPSECPFRCFMRTEADVRAYSEKCTPWRLNYYIYDYESIDVYVEGTPAE